MTNMPRRPTRAQRLAGAALAFALVALTAAILLSLGVLALTAIWGAIL